jgi:hypothetical protein
MYLTPREVKVIVTVIIGLALITGWSIAGYHLGMMM